VTQAVDETQLTPLHGSVHPLAQKRYDRGPVNESAAAERILLLLNRPPDREAAFQQYLREEHTVGSPLYHHWLTPEAIGAQFGLADGDVQAVTGWLSGNGLTVSRVSKAKRFVEFSGTVGQVNAAFHTQVHQYLVDGVVHHANATELKIPQALAPAIAGVSPVNDFRATSQIQVQGTASWNAAQRKMQAGFTEGPSLYAVAPADFATQYDLNPLYTAGVNGSGVTIGIINESNIDLSEAAAFRSVFGLPANPVQVIIDGSDPGWNDADVEAYLDVETSGAVAPSATVNLYISAGSAYQDPVVVSALRAVEDNQADILSVSFGEGENYEEASGNQFWNALWEQAAAQGQTVLVASGDEGQSQDTYFLFVGVNGLASTPWDIAVGGTDFYYSDYATGGASSANDWNATNDPTTKGSLKAPITEQVWNDPFGLDTIPGLPRGEIYAGGGGASNCVTTDTNGQCTGGYPKPSWQTGPGVPQDGVRDLPDVSLFASNGANFSAYAVCGQEGQCIPDGSGSFAVDLVGGTSASAPSMAGVMALVDQKYGRQGQADVTLYPLAQQKAAAFQDITLGGNWDLCEEGAPDCDLGVDGLGQYTGESTVYSAGPGYDQASGLGTVDATSLVNNWGSITFQGTTTSLDISPASVVHGHAVTVDAKVTASAGSGTPAGAVTLLTNSTMPNNASQTAIPLVAGSGDASLNYLPGGTYQVTARYGGDGTYAASSSSAQTLTVSPEKSTLNFSVAPADGISLTDLPYGYAVSLDAQPVGVNAATGQTDGNATGSVTFTLDGAQVTVPLNAGGMAAWPTPMLSVGTHTASASYSGDNSFGASSAQAVTFTVLQGGATIFLNPSLPEGEPINAGTPLTVSLQLEPFITPSLAGQTAAPGMAPPTGTVTLLLDTYTSQWNTVYTETAKLVAPTGIYGDETSFATVTFPALPVGQYYFVPNYSGDTNYMPFACPNPAACSQGFYYFNVVAAAGTPAASTTILTVTPSNITAAQTATVTATVNAPAGAKVAPTGWISFFDNGTPMGGSYYMQQLVPATSGASASFSLTLGADSFYTNGMNQLSAIYSGDSNYQGSTSNTTSLSVAQWGADFTMTPQLTQINVVTGNTVNSGVNLASLWGFNGSVALSCTTSTSDFSCSINPQSATVNGTATASLNVVAVNPNAATATTAKNSSALRGIAGAALAFAFVLMLPLRRGKWRTTAGLLLVAVALFTSGCGSNSSSGPPPPPSNGTTPGTYSILVTGTTGAIVHTMKMMVVVTSK
jgi:hypothetical protein